MKNNIAKIIALTSLMALSFSSMANDYYIVYDLPEGSFSSDPLQVQKDAWTELVESIGRTAPEDWSSGLDVGCSRKNCYGDDIYSLPDEKYPASDLTGGIDIGFQRNISDISALSSIKSMSGNLRLNNMNGPSLLPLSNMVVENGGHIYLYESKLTSLKGLENIKTAKYVLLRDNNLTNLDGLEGLESAALINAKNNNLNDISALSNLKHLGYSARINLWGNPDLQDLSPLNNMSQFARNSCSYPCASLRVENRPYATKLSANSAICQEIAIGKTVVKDGDTLEMLDPNLVCEM